jgi:hypothetical protein
MRIAVVLILFAASTYSTGFSVSTSKRRIPCETPVDASSCYWAYGRLGSYLGTPSFRLWKIGTHRVLGIYSGPSVDRYNCLDNEDPEFPPKVEKAFHPFGNRIFADFKICPLEPERAGVMQAACIEAAKNIVVDK